MVTRTVLRHARRVVHSEWPPIAWLRRHHLLLLALFTLIALPLWAFGELADEVLEGEGFSFDEPVLLAMREFATPTIDRIMVFFTIVGYGGGVVPASIGIGLLLIVLRRFGDARFFALAVGGSALINVLAKNFFDRIRPELWVSTHPEITYSFPSGHAMGSMALVLALWVLARPTPFGALVLVLGLPFVVLVGLSRIYLGVHWPSDILAGWCAATAWVLSLSGLLYHHLGKPTPRSEPEPAL